MLTMLREWPGIIVSISISIFPLNVCGVNLCLLSAPSQLHNKLRERRDEESLPLAFGNIGIFMLKTTRLLRSPQLNHTDIRQPTRIVHSKIRNHDNFVVLFLILPLWHSLLTKANKHYFVDCAAALALTLSQSQSEDVKDYRSKSQPIIHAMTSSLVFRLSTTIFHFSSFPLAHPASFACAADYIQLVNSLRSQVKSPKSIAGWCWMEDSLLKMHRLVLVIRLTANTMDRYFNREAESPDLGSN